MVSLCLRTFFRTSIMRGSLMTPSPEQPPRVPCHARFQLLECHICRSRTVGWNSVGALPGTCDKRRQQGVFHYSRQRTELEMHCLDLASSLRSFFLGHFNNAHRNREFMHVRSTPHPTSTIQVRPCHPT